MVKLRSSTNLIFRQRLYFLVEILIIFLGIFLFLLIPTFVPNLVVDVNSRAYEPLYFLFRAFIILAAIPIFLIVSNFALQSQKRKLILKEDVSPSKNFINLLRIPERNYKYQLLYGLLLLFLVFIPLDFFTYLIFPNMLEYLTIALDVYSPASFNSYLLESYSYFIISVLIIQSSVAIYEESLSRGFLANRGSDYLNNMSAVIMSSFFFGLGHFSYIFTSYTIDLPILFPIIWFLQTFFVGIILAMVVIRKRWLFPAFFAHAINNIISANTIWNYLQGNSFFPFSLYLYCPLLVISLLLLIWQFRRIKEGLSIGVREFGAYFKNDTTIKENTSHKIVRIIADFLFGLIIYIIGIILI
ncbi:MAG: CPBP family intramembrane glutamic endopeptidase [Candidatus Thorarchaeota archaeon]